MTLAEQAAAEALHDSYATCVHAGELWVCREQAQVAVRAALPVWLEEVASGGFDGALMAQVAHSVGTRDYETVALIIGRYIRVKLGGKLVD